MWQFLKNDKKLSRIAIFIIFLALIRTITEPFRLQYVSTENLTFAQIKPFLLGALTAALGLLLMISFSFYNKYKTIILICVLTIIVMIIIKFIFLA